MISTVQQTSCLDAGKSSGVDSLAFLQIDYSQKNYFAPYGRALAHDGVPVVLSNRVTVVQSIGNETMSQPVSVFYSPGITEVFVPRTPLGKRLVVLRRKAIQAGMKLLTEDEVLEEVRRRRGELEDDEANLY